MIANEAMGENEMFRGHKVDRSDGVPASQGIRFGLYSQIADSRHLSGQKLYTIEKMYRTPVI